MGRQRSLPSKAVHFVSDITTVILNPISDKPSKPSPLPFPPPEVDEADTPRLGSLSDEEESSYHSAESGGGPDTSSFTAFLTSLLSPSDPKDGEGPEAAGSDSGSEVESKPNIYGPEPGYSGRGRKSLFSRGKQSIGKAMKYAVKFGGLSRSSQGSKESGGEEVKSGDEKKNIGGVDGDGHVTRLDMKSKEKEGLLVVHLPEMSDRSTLLTEKTRNVLYVSLPSLAIGRKWVLLYSTWRHGISLSTLYRRSKLCSGPSLLVVGDCKGAVFGGLVETPLQPAQRKYQGSSSTFLFTDTPGHPVIYHPTGVNRYFTLCSPKFLAMGGGDHFALYLDSDLLNGTSSASETYGNPCLAHSQEFVVKEVELWAFVYASKYEQMLALCREEAPGICRW